MTAKGFCAAAACALRTASRSRRLEGFVASAMAAISRRNATFSMLERWIIARRCALLGLVFPQGQWRQPAVASLDRLEQSRRGVADIDMTDVAGIV
jgi:hypothetical protein